MFHLLYGFFNGLFFAILSEKGYGPKDYRIDLRMCST